MIVPSIWQLAPSSTERQPPPPQDGNARTASPGEGLTEKKNLSTPGIEPPATELHRLRACITARLAPITLSLVRATAQQGPPPGLSTRARPQGPHSGRGEAHRAGQLLPSSA